MARPVSIQTGGILEVARKIFMRDGYQASTVRIAREAGVSEGSLFKHFKNKTNLFLTAMEVEAGDQEWADHLLACVGRVTPQVALERVGMQLLEQFRLILPRLMMINASGVIIPNHESPGELPSPLQKMDVLRRYLEAEIKAGRLAMKSPSMQAHAFLGALAHYAWCETLFGYQSGTSRAFVKNIVETILKATLVPGGGNKGRPGKQFKATQKR